MNYTKVMNLFNKNTIDAYFEVKKWSMRLFLF